MSPSGLSGRAKLQVLVSTHGYRNLIFLEQAQEVHADIRAWLADRMVQGRPVIADIFQ